MLYYSRVRAQRPPREHITHVWILQPRYFHKYFRKTDAGVFHYFGPETNMKGCLKGKHNNDGLRLLAESLIHLSKLL